MRLIHKMPFSSQEIESYRQLVYDNLTRGIKYILDAMPDMSPPLCVTEDNEAHIELIENARDLRDGEPFPKEYYEPLKRLWADEGVKQAWARGNEAALPEKCVDTLPAVVHSLTIVLAYSTSSTTLTGCSIRSTHQTIKILCSAEHGPLGSLRQPSTSGITIC